MKDLEKNVRAETARVIALLGKAKHVARSVGMWQTYHLIDKAEEKSGWEAAEMLKEFRPTQGKEKG